jgi:hypothetical protein
MATSVTAITSRTSTAIWSGVWIDGGADPGLTRRRDARTAGETMKISDSGILWAASDKHAGGEFETPELSWTAIAALARGENPFAGTT